MRYLITILTIILYSLTNSPCLAQNKPTNRPPVIKHEAISTAVKGQSISVRAVVTSQPSSIKSVTLLYTQSKDAAPFKIAMQEAGAGSYFGVIPSSLIKGLNEFSYYIEAIDVNEMVSETPWHTVKLQVPQQSVAPPIQSAPPVVVAPHPGANTSPARQVETPKESWSWKGPAIIAGSAAAVVGGALLIANSGNNSDSSDDSSGSGGTSITNAGTYTGTATRYLEMTGGTPSSESYAITITVISSGTVTSDNLHPGSHMEDALSGTEFQMNGTVSDANLTGQIVYSGTLLSGRITGSIAGAVTSSTGTNGTYSGIFSATKQ